MGYSRTNSNRGLRIYFSEKNPGIFRFVTLALEIPEKTRHPFSPWKFQGKRTTHGMEIPHELFLNTPGNSTSFLIDHWNFHMLFQYPWCLEVPCPQPYPYQVSHTLCVRHTPQHISHAHTNNRYYLTRELLCGFYS